MTQDVTQCKVLAHKQAEMIRMKEQRAVAVMREIAPSLDDLPAEETTHDDVVTQFAPKKLSHEPVDNIGRLAGEAVERSWELAAQDVERMGQQLAEQHREVQDLVAATAGAIRVRGSECLRSIENAVAMSDLVSKQCNVLRAKLALGAIVANVDRDQS